MDRNLILAIVMSVVIILAFQVLFPPATPPPAKKTPAPTETVHKPEHATTPAEKAKEVPTAQVVPSTLAPSASSAEEVRIKIDALTYEAVLSSVGARIVSFKLKDYKMSVGGSELVNFFPSEGPDTAGPTVVLTTRDQEIDDSSLGYQADLQGTSVVLDRSGATKAISLRTTTPAGLTIVKTFTFHADRYLVDFSLTLANGATESRDYLVKFPWRKGYVGEGAQQFSWNSAEILLNDQLKDYYLKDIKGDEEASGKVGWAGLGDVYFFKALVFGDKPAGNVTLFKPSKGMAEIWVRFGSVDLPPGKSVETNLGLYLGPKERAALEGAGHELSKALVYSHYAVLEFMSEYLMKFLRLCNNGFHAFGIKIPGTQNYGLDIIILTVLIKILFIPLTHKSMKSMKRMQELQPQIAKLKEKLKDDKTALNKATMELFREQKVNPLGSCWPMLLQLPVFIALYQVLGYAIELRHASFVCFPSIYLCINDLSAPDPYYVTPILMGGTMVLQQWMTPSGGDPTQKKMMLLMPVVFTYLFLNFPSGLVLYWLVNNVLSIGQQVVTNRLSQ
jgi:YidC/Oxa1 family membrane protein insertase